MGNKDLVQAPYDTTTATVSSGGQTSTAIDLGGMTLVGMYLPSSLTSTAITFTVSHDGVATYQALYDKTGTQYSVTVAASRFVLLPPTDFAGVRYLKLVCGSAEGGDRSIVLVCRTV